MLKGFFLFLFLFSFSGLQQAHFWATSNWHINFGSRIRHLALAAVPQVSCMYDIGCCSTIFCGLLSFPSTIFVVSVWCFSVSVWFHSLFFPYTSFVLLSSLPVLCLLHVSFSCLSFRYFTIIFVCFLSKRQVSKCTQSLALFYSSIKYISLRFLYTYISYNMYT